MAVIEASRMLGNMYVLQISVTKESKVSRMDGCCLRLSHQLFKSEPTGGAAAAAPEGGALACPSASPHLPWLALEAP
jgi:hypothetical protein